MWHFGCGMMLLGVCSPLLLQHLWKHPVWTLTPTGGMLSIEMTTNECGQAHLCTTREQGAS